MKCPVCKEINLEMSERQGIEIDYCPECRGIWLDRGELDKLIEKNDNQINHRNQGQQDSEFNMKESNNYNKDNYYENKNGRKKESFITNVFDMFGGD
jgi:uncharacterized protein